MNSFSKAVGGREKIHLSRLTGNGGRVRWECISESGTGDTECGFIVG